jgi:hypothetical protein
MSAFADPLEQTFIAGLFGEDELGVVVRAHIHIEAQLVDLLGLLVIDVTYLERMNLDFSQQVNLAVALGLDPDQAPTLSALGKLRNAFAHRLDTELSESRVNNLYEALSARGKEIVQEAYDRTNAQMSQDGPAFGKLSPKTRFVLIAIPLRSILLTAIREIRERQLKP